jgi:transposase
MAACLFCSRSSVPRTVRLDRAGQLGWSGAANGQLGPPVRTTVLLPWRKRSLRPLLKTPPRAYGWGRTRWSGATLAAPLKAKHGLDVSAWTVRRWLHARGWVGKRPKLRAKDDDPERVARVARIRLQREHLQPREVLVFADALDIHWLPKVGAAWRPKGSQEEGMTPGTNEKHSLAGALHLETGQVIHCFGPRQNKGLFRALLTLLDHTSPDSRVSRIDVVVDNDCIHKAKAVNEWLAAHPRCELLWLPTYCPRANPIERVFGDVHDKCTRNHKRKRLRDVLSEVERHCHFHGPWRYKLSKIYDEPEVTAVVARMKAQRRGQIAA